MNLERLLQIDRRVIFLLLAICMVIPLICQVDMPVGVQRTTQLLYDTVDQIDVRRQALIISSDYTPQTEAENHPMTVALLRHAFARKLPVLTLCLYVEATPLMANAVEQVMEEFNSVAATNADSVLAGRDIVFLGWQPPPIIPILAMGRSISGIYPVDYYGNATAEMPVLQRIRNYDQVGLVAAISSGVSPLWFVQFAQTKFGVKVGAGTTAVSAPGFYPYIETGQLSGMMGGMKGAAEYENMVAEKYGADGRRRASEGMTAQSAAHILIMAFVIIGNVAYFASRRKKA